MLLKSIPEAPDETPHVHDTEMPFPPLRILLVDDDDSLRELYAEVLADSGYQVDTARDGEAGWQAIYAENYTPDAYDLLITDNNMPKLTGIGLIKKVRSAGLNLPIILASGSIPEDTEAIQADAMLPKPFASDELLKLVEKVLHTDKHRIAQH